MSFCPLRSTAEKEVECNEACQWFVQDKKNNYYSQCGFICMNRNLSSIAIKLTTVEDYLDALGKISLAIVETIAKDIHSIEDSIADLAGKNS